VRVVQSAAVNPRRRPPRQSAEEFNQGAPGGSRRPSGTTELALHAAGRVASADPRLMSVVASNLAEASRRSSSELRTPQRPIEGRYIDDKSRL
jgi:hypothetical protein